MEQKRLRVPVAVVRGRSAGLEAPEVAKDGQNGSLLSRNLCFDDYSTMPSTSASAKKLSAKSGSMEV
jgi:hypothetical protein